MSITIDVFQSHQNNIVDDFFLFFSSRLIEYCMAELIPQDNFYSESNNSDKKIVSMDDWTMIWNFSDDIAQQIQEQVIDRIRSVCNNLSPNK